VAQEALISGRGVAEIVEQRGLLSHARIAEVLSALAAAPVVRA
jgi:aspartate ammonia-lyase